MGWLHTFATAIVWVMAALELLDVPVELGAEVMEAVSVLELSWATANAAAPRITNVRSMLRVGGHASEAETSEIRGGRTAVKVATTEKRGDFEESKALGPGWRSGVGRAQLTSSRP